MDFINLIVQNLISPAILFFILGIVAGCLKSDLKIPDSISSCLAIYLMMGIGFKGGVAIRGECDTESSIMSVVIAGVFISVLTTFLGYVILRLTTKLNNITAAAIAAHFGSVSIVTFATAVTFLKAKNVCYDGYIVSILGIMEAPPILAGLFIAHQIRGESKNVIRKEKKLTQGILTNGSVLLLLGSFFVGWLTGYDGMSKVEGFLVAPFQGVLCLFLLDMGLCVATSVDHLKTFNIPMILFGLYMPLIGGSIGLLASYMIGLSVGTGTLFIVLCASASYIAVPAAMRLALPEANAGIYIPMSLGITFPFNIALGIPLYFAVASKFLG